MTTDRAEHTNAPSGCRVANSGLHHEEGSELEPDVVWRSSRLSNGMAEPSLDRVTRPSCPSRRPGGGATLSRLGAAPTWFSAADDSSDAAGGREQIGCLG